MSIICPFSTLPLQSTLPKVGGLLNYIKTLKKHYKSNCKTITTKWTNLLKFDPLIVDVNVILKFCVTCFSSPHEDIFYILNVFFS